METTGFQSKAIAIKDSFSDRLKSARKKKGVTLARAEHDTKIRSKYLEAIEDNRFDLVPPSHSKGFIRRYAEYLGFKPEDTEQAIALLPLGQATKQPFSVRAFEKETIWLVTPKVILSALSVIVLLGFIGYITYQVRQFAAPPTLAVTKPTTESVVTSEALTVEGKTEPGVTVYVDGVATSTSSDGTFTYPLTLRPGLNQVTVRAENRIKKDATKVISVLYQGAPATPVPDISPTPSPTPSQ